MRIFSKWSRITLDNFMIDCIRKGSVSSLGTMLSGILLEEMMNSLLKECRILRADGAIEAFIAVWFIF